MCKVYGYARISRKEQSIDRQVRNILAKFPGAVMVTEAFTGTKVEGRKEFEKLIKTVKAGDTIVFDSVSRMSRNAADGIAVYEELFSRGVNLTFLKEPHISTATYAEALSQTIAFTGNEIADMYIETTNKVLAILRRKQIEQAFEQAEKEVTDLHERTSEGIETARRNGKQIGQKAGSKLTVKKAIESKAIIAKHSRDFNGTLSDAEVMTLCGISRNTYYKYKKEMAEEV